MTPSPDSVRFDEDSFWANLCDSRTFGIPLDWFPRLLNAAPEARTQVTLTPYGLHRGALDEDVSPIRTIRKQE